MVGKTYRALKARGNSARSVDLLLALRRSVWLRWESLRRCGSNLRWSRCTRGWRRSTFPTAESGQKESIIFAARTRAMWRQIHYHRWSRIPFAKSPASSTSASPLRLWSRPSADSAPIPPHRTPWPAQTISPFWRRVQVFASSENKRSSEWMEGNAAHLTLHVPMPVCSPPNLALKSPKGGRRPGALYFPFGSGDLWTNCAEPSSSSGRRSICRTGIGPYKKRIPWKARRMISFFR